MRNPHLFLYLKLRNICLQTGFSFNDVFNDDVKKLIWSWRFDCNDEPTENYDLKMWLDTLWFIENGFAARLTASLSHWPGWNERFHLFTMWLMVIITSCFFWICRYWELKHWQCVTPKQLNVHVMVGSGVTGIWESSHLWRQMVVKLGISHSLQVFFMIKLFFCDLIYNEQTL